VARFPYSASGGEATSAMPWFSLTLSRNDRSVEVTGLLDTGAAVNVLPYSVGLALGAVWEEQTVPVPLTGSLGKLEARALLLKASHPVITGLQTVRLAFAWAQTESVPVIFGQTNFFLEFDVCFFRSQSVFEITVKS
jgi:hypothetical protein